MNSLRWLLHEPERHSLDLLQKCFLQEVGKGKRLKGKGKIQNLSPFPPAPYPLLGTPPFPYPDFCKKSLLYKSP